MSKRVLSSLLLGSIALTHGNEAVLAAQGAASTPTPTPILAPGDVVPPFDAEGLDGVVKHVGFPKGSTTLLLFFLSSCPTCHKMIPEWNKAYEKRSRGLDVLGVLMDREPPGFFMATPVLFPVVRSHGRQLAQTYRIHRVPLTLRVGPGGKVEDAGMGALDPIRLGEIFRSPTSR